MKPSERIEEIRQKLIVDVYVKSAGNYYSRAAWWDKCASDDQFLWKALMEYLDEAAR